MATFEEEVTKVVSLMTQTADGKWTLPEGELSEGVKYAANAERRRRDTQTALSKAESRASTLERENNELVKNWENDVASSLTVAQREELDELKTSDPDAWRTRLNELETANRDSLATRRKDISDKAKTETELEKRTRLIEEYNAANPDKQLTDDVIENDLPPRFMKDLVAGKATFEEFIENSAGYLSAGKVVAKGEAPPNVPDLSQAGGSSTPSQDAVDSEAASSYNDDVF